MSIIECNLSEKTTPLPDPKGQRDFSSTCLSELEFPRKLEACNV